MEQPENQTALQPVSNNAIVRPMVNADEALQAWNDYIQLKKKVADKEDIQKIGDKDFLKKSYWRKIATFFNLNVEVVEERKEQLGKTLVWHFTCKATAPNGRFAIGTGSCDAFEKATMKDGKYMQKGDVTKWGKSSSGKSYPLEWAWTPAQPNSIHNIRTTAETRAFNRAVSNLVGGGEVSADEIVDREAETQPKAAPAPKKMTKAQNDKIWALIGELGWDTEKFKEKVKTKNKLESFNDVTMETAKKIIDSLTKAIEQEKAKAQAEEAQLADDYAKDTAEGTAETIF